MAFIHLLYSHILFLHLPHPQFLNCLAEIAELCVVSIRRIVAAPCIPPCKRQVLPALRFQLFVGGVEQIVLLVKFKQSQHSVGDSYKE